jgi:septal ring factor EnvC (AmiA/AmiB activator)
MNLQEKETTLSEMRQEIAERSAKIEEIFSHLSTDIPELRNEMKQLKKELTERLVVK